MFCLFCTKRKTIAAGMNLPVPIHTSVYLKAINVMVPVTVLMGQMKKAVSILQYLRIQSMKTIGKTIIS